MGAASCQIVLLALGLAAVGCGGGGGAKPHTATVPAPPVPQPHGMVLTSPAFAGGGRIPDRYTCRGRGLSPPLRWEGVPADATDLALYVVDTEAPGGQYVHWTMWGLNPRRTSIAAGAVPAHAVQGVNSHGGVGWTPPCPPVGDRPHHYVFRLYALSDPIALPPGAAPGSLIRKTFSALASAALVGRFSR